MRKNIWKYLTEKDSSTSHQIKGLQLIIIILIIVLVTPIVWHHLGIASISSNENLIKLDSLTQVYIESLESEKIASVKRIDKEETLVFNFKGERKRNWNNKYKKKYIESKIERKQNDFSNKEDEKKSITLINLNKAGLKDLKTIYGIGDVLAKRIVKFRDKLGGYYTISQLKEVYGIDSTMLPTINNYINKKDSLVVNKIKVNQLEFKQLLKHPYLNYKEVQTIFNNRPITDRNICRFLKN